jgi:ATP-binding cassette subfamily F protein uup
VAVLVDLDKVTVRHGDRTLFNDLSMTVSDRDRIGVVGSNGAGKSTLLRILAGVDRPHSGAVRRGRGVRTGYLDQEPRLSAGTVASAVGESWQSAAILQRLGMAEAAEMGVGDLSGGQAKRVALARVLVEPFELLVLDEPTNHLDLTAIAWLEQWLSAFRGGLVLVSHDRHLLDRVTTRMIEIDHGDTYAHDGGYSAYLAARSERGDRATSAEATRRNLARRELAWLRRGAPARTRKPKARIDTALDVLGAKPSTPAGQMAIEVDGITPRLGDKVIDCHEVSYHYDDSGTDVLSSVDLSLAPDERLGLLGRNGCGKSTLLQLLAGRLLPTAGTIEMGPTVVVGYYDQDGVAPEIDKPVRELVAGRYRPPGAPKDVALMERFLFRDGLQFAKPSTLSGGERRRLQLLLVLAERPNVLLLDEPTNDLDLETLRILEDFLEDWRGAVVVVSHDRTFLQRTTERLCSVDSGRLHQLPAGLDAWLAEVTNVVADSTAGTKRPATLPAAGRRHPSDRGTSTKTPSPSTVGRRLREAEREMDRLSKAREALHRELVAASSDHVRLAELGRALTELSTRLTEAEERWLALAEAER